MKVLHIVNWYPHKGNDKQALFIQRQIASLSPYIENQEIIHVRVQHGRPKISSFTSEGVLHRIWNIPTKKWFLLELISSILLFFTLLRARANRFDVLNVHIAYPNLTYWHWIRRWIKPKMVITEHWSAYHFNFNLPKPPPRIQRIFRQDLAVICVSRALLQDIQEFSGTSFPFEIVPNIVDDRIFYRKTDVKRESGRFFMVSQWKEPKDPFVPIRAFYNLWKRDKSLRFIIGGYGPQWATMRALVDELEIAESVEWFETMDSAQIALEMNRASAYVHCSGYETFSVVCAEALACGCYLIASEVGGIPELVSPGTGLLVKEPSIEAWTEALGQGVETKEIPCMNRFYPEEVGKRYYEALKSFVDNELEKT